MSARTYDPLPDHLKGVGGCASCDHRGDIWFLCSYHEGLDNGFESGRDAALEEAAKVAEQGCNGVLCMREQIAKAIRTLIHS